MEEKETENILPAVCIINQGEFQLKRKNTIEVTYTHKVQQTGASITRLTLVSIMQNMHRHRT